MGLLAAPGGGRREENPPAPSCSPQQRAVKPQPSCRASPSRLAPRQRRGTGSCSLRYLARRCRRARCGRSPEPRSRSSGSNHHRWRSCKRRVGSARRQAREKGKGDVVPARPGAAGRARKAPAAPLGAEAPPFRPRQTQPNRACTEHFWNAACPLQAPVKRPPAAPGDEQGVGSTGPEPLRAQISC